MGGLGAKEMGGGEPESLDKSATTKMAAEMAAWREGSTTKSAEAVERVEGWRLRQGGWERSWRLEVGMEEVVVTTEALGEP